MEGDGETVRARSQGGAEQNSVFCVLGILGLLHPRVQQLWLPAQDLCKMEPVSILTWRM